MKAREVFRDCEYAKECLQRAIDQKRLKDAKLFWFAALAMLRAIGHVLHKVDAEQLGVNFRNALEDRFKLWKQTPIFKDFIERERNYILKQYDSSLSEKETMEEGFLLTEEGDTFVTEEGDPFVVTTTDITLVKENGIYSGASPVNAISKALEWWDKELSELERIESQP